MRMNRHIAAACLCAAVISCGGPKPGKTVSREFPVVQVPAMMDDASKVEYLSYHYWDNLLDAETLVDCDTSAVSAVSIANIEQAFANYVFILEQLPLDKGQECMAVLTKKIIACRQQDKGNIQAFMKVVERYLYNVNSPLRDEDLMTPYARMMASDTTLEQSQRDLYARWAALSSLNARESIAADFSFTLRNGKVKTLHGVKADYTLLFFSNPGCHACKDIIDALVSSVKLSEKTASGDLAVVNVYIDEQLQEWMEYSSVYPAVWYNGFDHNGVIRADELYNVRAIPSLYLLDENKRVILKDTTFERVIATLENLF